jgi:hypothetical protein
VSALSRIAQLHRELAEAYEKLEHEETRPRTRKARKPVEPIVESSKEEIDQVRRALRRSGVSA